MVEADQNLEQALRAKSAEARYQRLRVLWIAAAAGSYAADTVFLGLFAWAGTIAVWTPVWYGVGAALFSAVFYAVTVSRWNLKLKDASMVAAQTLARFRRLSYFAAQAGERARSVAEGDSPKSAR
jgi:hypothetical protein